MAQQQNPYTYPDTQGAERTVWIDLGDGKVTGTVAIQYIGDGGVIIGTLGAHVNDDKPGIEYGGAGYIGRIWVKRNEDGTWYVDPENSWNRTSSYGPAAPRFTRRDNWSDAGKLASRMIIERLLAAMEEHYEPQRELLGDAAEAERDAHRAWDDYAKAKATADEARKVLRAAERKLEKARKAATPDEH